MKNILLALSLAFLCFSISAQGVKIGTTPGNPDPSAMLEIESTDRGFLPPRMTQAQRDSINNPAVGLQIFNTSNNCLEFYVGSSWQAIECGCTGAPSTPGVITGNSSVCNGALSESYSVSSVMGATSYQWSIPLGAVISSGAGTNSITVDFGSSSGNVSVQAVNSCGISSTQTLAVTLISAPSTPGAISGDLTPCENELGVQYSIAAVPGASSYNWQVPAGASISSGANTNTITVDFASSGGTVSVTASNSCGTSAASSITVNLDTIPNSSFSPTAALVSTSTSFIPVVTGGTYGWTFSSGTPSSSSAQSPSVSWASTGNYNVVLIFTDGNGCSSSTTNSVNVRTPTVVTFNYTGAPQSWQVPAGVTSIQVDAYGAQGGTSGGAIGGLGGRAQATIPVTPGETLNIYVGQQGSSSSGVLGPTFGGGGGIFHSSGSGAGGSGGGASDVRRGTALGGRLIVAAGGGGHGWISQTLNGGNGGGFVGGTGGAANGNNSWSGKGGTQTTGGASGGPFGNITSGSLGQGGDGDGDGAGGGGGGGGYYGGGGGRYSGGGGGSSWVASPGNTNTSTTSGVKSGNGEVVITY